MDPLPGLRVSLEAHILTDENRPAYIAKSLAAWDAIAARRPLAVAALADYVQAGQFAKDQDEEPDEVGYAEGCEPVQALTPPSWRELRGLPPINEAWKPKPLEPGAARYMALEGGALVGSDPTWHARETYTDEFRTKARGESWFNRHIRNETGKIQDPKQREKSARQKAMLLADSHRIAKRLEANGIPGYRSDKWDVWLYLIHSGEKILLPKFRRCVLIPATAAATRADILRALEYYDQCQFANVGAQYLRFWTLTSGKRVKLSGLRQRVKEFHRRISRLNAQDFMLEAGVRIVFRSTELGTVEGLNRDGSGRLLEAGQIEFEDGEAFFHVHAHCVVRLVKGRLDPHAWKAFLKRLRAYWGDWMDDDSVIRDMRECCKYVTKPRDLHALTDPQLVELFHQLKDLHLVQPLGELREEIKARKKAGLVLVKEDSANGEGRIWAERPSPNSGYAKKDEAATAETLDAIKMAGGGDGLPDGFKPMCNVVGRSMPVFNRNGLKEPAVIVCGNLWTAITVETHPLVLRMRAQTLQEFLAGEKIRVHTGTSTVLATVEGAESGPPGRENWMAEEVFS